MTDTSQDPAVTTGTTHVVFILDASGSMSSIQSEAIELFNSQINAVRSKTINGRSTATYATFGTQSRPIIHYVGQPLETLQPLTAENYRPDGMTPMLDAIGWTVERVEQELIKPDEEYAVLVIIISDGAENHSGSWQMAVPAEERHRAYQAWEIAELVKRLEGTGNWTFTFLGANVDLREVSGKLGLQESNVQAFVASKAGMAFATDSLSKASMSYMELRTSGKRQSKAFYGKSEDEKDKP